MEKLCKTCNEFKNYDDFYKASKHSDGRQYKCKSCDTGARRINQATPEYRKKVYSRRKLMIEKLRKIKESVPCFDCNQYYEGYVMQFDHVRGVKKFNLSRAGTDTTSMETIQEEMNKCEIVCANCHARRTWKRNRDETN